MRHLLLTHPSSALGTTKIRLLVRPYPRSQVESLYLPSPERRLDDALHPDLVRPLVGQLPDRGVLREEAVPVGPPVAGAHRGEEGGDGRRAKVRRGGDPVASAVDLSDLSGEPASAPDEQHRIGLPGLHLYLPKAPPPLEHLLELLERRDGEV